MDQDRAVHRAGAGAAGRGLCGLCVHRLPPHRRHGPDACERRRGLSRRHHRYALHRRVLQHRLRRLRGRLRLLHGRRHRVPGVERDAPDGEPHGDRRLPAGAGGGLLSGAGGGHGLHPHLSGGRASLYHRRTARPEQRVLPELRLPLPVLSHDPAPRRIPLRPADPLRRRHHGGQPRGAAGGGRLHEAAGPGPLLFRQPHPRGER